MLFVPLSMLKEAKPFGTAPPPSGYYKVKPVRWESLTKKDGTVSHARKLFFRFENGAETNYLLDPPFLTANQDGRAVMVNNPDMTDDQRTMSIRRLRSIFDSCGFNPATLEGQGFFTEDMLLQAESCYVEWIGPQAGVQGSFGNIQAFLKKDDYEVKVSSGAVPTAYTKRSDGTQPGPVGSAGYVPPAAGGHNFAPPPVPSAPSAMPSMPSTPSIPTAPTPPSNLPNAPSIPNTSAGGFAPTGFTLPPPPGR